MSQLMLKLKKPIGGTELEVLGVVANIYGIPKSDRDQHKSSGQRKAHRNLIIPVGEETDYLPVNVDPGRYLVEAILPSGEVVAKEISVDDEHEIQKVELLSEESPYEWLDWQHFIGNVQRSYFDYKQQLESLYSEASPEIEKGISVWTQLKTASTRVLESPRIRTGLSSLTSWISDSLPQLSGPSNVDSKQEPVIAWLRNTLFKPEELRNVEAQLVSVATPPPDKRKPDEMLTPGELASQGYFLNILRSKNATTVSHFKNAFRIEDLSTFITEELHPTVDDKLSQLYRFVDAPKRDFGENRITRHFMFLCGDDITLQYSVLPVPWSDSGLHRNSTVEVLVRLGGTETDTTLGSCELSRLSVTVSDQLVGSVLGYMAAGNLPLAAEIVMKSRGLLFEKPANPLAAAAGIYVLLMVQQAKDVGDLNTWARNLMDDFEWLPDGAIQNAWVQLKLGNQETRVSEARDSFLKACRRGLPVYSNGISMLLDGLTLFANDARAENRQDLEVELALQTIWPLAVRTNMRQPFTTIVLS